MSQLHDSGFPWECERNYGPDGASLSHHLQHTVSLVLPRLDVGFELSLQQEGDVVVGEVHHQVLVVKGSKIIPDKTKMRLD